MSFFDFEHPAALGFGAFLTLTTVYWLWSWIRWDDSGIDHHPKMDQ
jgi:hypothetical protein